MLMQAVRIFENSNDIAVCIAARRLYHLLICWLAIIELKLANMWLKTADLRSITMACVSVCSKNAITVVDKIKNYNAVINNDKCINCHACEKVCPVNNNTELKAPISIEQGWADNNDIRNTSSSGGLATAISYSFIINGGVVCGCLFHNGNFVFKIVDSVNDLHLFQGSKYVKSNPINAYKEIERFLKNGKKVLFIGLPCQCDGIKRYFGLKLQENLYTIDLICHGSPSPLILKKYLSEKNLDLDDVESISFRKKAFFSLYINRKKIVPNRVRDRYMILFLSGICYTENCYHCGYATLNRVSDITLGDSWGSELSLEEQKKGVSLIICQSDKGRKLIDMSNIHIEPVDPNKAIQSNHQLQSPSPLLPEREVFFKTFVKTESVSKAVKRCFPKICFKQNVKATLIKLKLLR